MKQLTFLLLLLSFCQVGFAKSGSPKNTNWKPLFGKDLNQAKFDKNCWKIDHGALTASDDKMIWAMGEYDRTPLPIGGLAPLGSLPRKEDFGSQEFGQTQKEHSTAGKKLSRGRIWTQAWPEGRTGGHLSPG